jgi:hypothetical protein
MGLSAMYFNKEKFQTHLKENYESDVFYKMVGFKEPQYTKPAQQSSNMFRRFIVTEIGDSNVN